MVEVSLTRGEKKPSRLRGIRLTALILALVLLLSAWLFSSRIKPVIVSMADSGVADLITVYVDGVVTRLMDEGEIQYSDLIIFDKDDEGRISALTTNMVGVNRLKASITAAVLDELTALEYTDIHIPIGSILGGSIFLGKGPKIPITLLSCTNIYTYFTSEFVTAGINQTKHSIVLHVDVSLDILVAGGAVSSVVKNQVNVAETIIVGIVPEAYASLG